MADITRLFTTWETFPVTRTNEDLRARAEAFQSRANRQAVDIAVSKVLYAADRDLVATEFYLVDLQDPEGVRPDGEVVEAALKQAFPEAMVAYRGADTVPYFYIDWEA